ncbi:MAG: ribosome silencing factor [Bacteroidales bacterium]|nr:ribosome silencing factor [Bacteroidales bacterium]
MPKKDKNDSEKLTTVIVEGILRKKGQQVLSLNLTKLPNAVSDYFIVCHGNTKIQVEAIADSVLDETIKELGAKPWHKEGFENAEWILLDYVDVVVHIFTEEARWFYNLEKLWADAQLKKYQDKKNNKEALND